MKNKVQEGTRMSLKSESHAGLGAGDLTIVGRVPVVACSDNPGVTGQLFEAETEGVFSLPKLAEGITQGAPLYWNGAALGATVTGNIPIGHAWETATTGATEVLCKIPSSGHRYAGTGIF